MTTLTAQHDHDHTPPECRPWNEFDFDPADAGGDPLTQVALDLASRRRDLQDLFIAAHKLNEAALRISEQLKELDQAVLDLQVEDAFTYNQDSPF
jgi:hypothetical protein